MTDDLLQLSLTSTHLLEGLKDSGNQAVWRQYVDRYRPLLVGYARRLNLSASDAEDAAQQILISFCQSYQAGKYERERGRLRDWLFGIARNQILNFRRRAAGGEALLGGGSSRSDFFERQPAENEMSAVWEEEWRGTVLRQCLGAVRAEVEPKTFEAFELFACQGVPATQVAERLGMTQNAVFGAKRRVLRRARELLAQYEDQW